MTAAFGKKRIVLHIGFPRCGSTLLQRHVFPQLEPGIKVVSPASEDRRLINFLIDKFIFSGRNIFLEPVTAEERDYVAAVLAEYPQSLVLISSEGLVGDVFENMLNGVHLSEALRGLFGEAEVLLVVRRQSEMIKSFYRHAVEEGYYRAYPAFVGFRDGRFSGFRLTRFLGLNAEPAAFDFFQAVGMLERIFGAGKVHVLPFEWIGRDFGRFCSLLSGYLGVDVPKPERSAPVVNRGLRRADLALLRAFNRVWDTRLFGLQLLPQLDLVSRYEAGRTAKSAVRQAWLRILVRLSPYFCYRLVRPLLSLPLEKIYSMLGLEELKREAAISAAIDAAVLQSNRRLNDKLGGLLTGLGYCDGPEARPATMGDGVGAR